MSNEKASGILRFLVVGDVVGKPGRLMCSRWWSRLRDMHSLDAIVVNGENSSNCGKGINEKSVEELFEAGADLITSGNHVWRFRDFYSYLDASDKVIRPANYPSSCPGKGYAFLNINGIEVAVLNLQGRVFFRETLDCPFKTAESQLLYLKSRSKIVLVDFHSEASSEKEAMGFFLDGKVSALIGTHTHVQTADERILPQGTAFIGDVGSCRARNSCLGVKKEAVTQMFLTQMPASFSVETKPPFIMCAVIIDIDCDTGKAVSVERLLIEDSIDSQ